MCKLLQLFRGGKKQKKNLSKCVYLQDDDDSADRCVISDGRQVRSLLEERWIIGSNHVDYQLSLGTELLQSLVVRRSHLLYMMFIMLC